MVFYLGSYIYIALVGIIQKKICEDLSLPKKMSQLFQIYIAAYSLVAILHFVGFLLLLKAKTNIPNQTLLMRNLAVVEILFCLYAVISFSVDIGAKDHGRLTREYFDAFFYCLFSVELRLSMLHTIMDRFIEIFLNIKYPLYMTHKRMLSLVAIHWSVSGACAIIITVLGILKIISI